MHSLPSARSVIAFFALTFALTIPFWILGQTGLQLFPGLPISAFGVVCPALAGAILTARHAGRQGLKDYFESAIDPRRAPRPMWFIAALLVFPALTAIIWLVMTLTGIALPAPIVSPVTVIILAMVFLIAGMAEELGWSGYATQPLIRKVGALPAALIIGTVWAVWHIIPFAQAHPNDPGWVFWQCIQTIALRVLIVWVFTNSGGSVLVAAVMHATVNLSDFLFPVNGSLYDPRFAAPAVAVAAAVIVIVFGARTLTRHKAAPAH